VEITILSASRRKRDEVVILVQWAQKLEKRGELEDGRMVLNPKSNIDHIGSLYTVQEMILIEKLIHNKHSK